MAQPMKKEAIKKAVAKKAPAKKVVKKTPAKKSNGPKQQDEWPTIEQRLKHKSEAFDCLARQYNALLQEHAGLKKSFSMIKDNYEREKNRLDKVIDTAFNNSSSLVEVFKDDTLCTKSDF